MSFDHIRDKFIEKFGKAKYEEFVLSLYESFPLIERLLFWQERLLEELCYDLSIPKPKVEEVYSIFNRCPIHNVELKQDTVLIINGNGYKPSFSLKEDKKLFPLANSVAIRDLDRFNYPESIKVLYCSNCRQEQSKRINQLSIK
jgi:hypothetical protein